ncbi:thiamineeeeeeeeeeeeeeee pyrophosphokinase [Candidatus Syntrophocurvum alkaliphilum]|uniref:Thiamine diphosphokinase n=1 Tax=Candidatus Syntrophocurvum alkaliphilum TaxID=2293317 RepID=A0A6I6DJY7_9FIRM|nr:thiamine diphosphokinase [Candidatus Syntrophocurvum alkaliphilum]QGU00879.1 thiamineeeeeeeeeeeeeeee pyrophosphokinase [Candidatus Syntrophocurvum alkaliphilum]
MLCVVLANGNYNGNIDDYKSKISTADIIICADGGANFAYETAITPTYIVGDMDSIADHVKSYYKEKGVKVKKYPKKKDFTDTQLSLMIAEEFHAIKEVVFLGTIGDRLDHTLSSIYSGIELVNKGIKVSHFTSDLTIYITNNKVEIDGEKGDIVSVLALSDEAKGITKTGFEYPLVNEELQKSNPYAISNILREERGTIQLTDGVLAVFHYK